MRRSKLAMSLAACLTIFSCKGPPEEHRGSAAEYDVVIRGGQIHDGTGAPGRAGDVGIRGDRIVFLGDMKRGRGKIEIAAKGLAVAPGFINMLSWADESLIADGKSQSDIRQGVTLEVFGEGLSMGPLNSIMKRELREHQRDIHYDVKWETLDGYLRFLEERGISPNVASFVGATTVRIHELGYIDRTPSLGELEQMCRLVREAMEDGALGVGASLIYAPAFYAKTDELIALARVAGEYGGMFICHLRSEANSLLEAVDELLRIARQAQVPAEIYHLKAAGESNWRKLDALIRRIEAARKEGLQVTADMYTYTAAATGLDASMPPWVQEGGYDSWAKRLRDPVIRERVKKEMRSDTDQWENFYRAAGSPERILLVGFKSERLKPLTGRTLGDVARERNHDPEDTAMDLVVEDGSRVSAVYFVMSEQNIRRELTLPWMSFGSDEGSFAPEGVFLRSNPHPRAYGNFARLLGQYVREEKILTLAEAVRRLSGLPATNLKLQERGFLRPGYFADVVVFDPETIIDHATYAKPHAYATGVKHVLVNGIPVLQDGEHTGATPGRVVRGPGWKKKLSGN